MKSYKDYDLDILMTLDNKEYQIEKIKALLEYAYWEGSKDGSKEAMEIFKTN